MLKHTILNLIVTIRYKIMIINGTINARTRLILAHGSGSDMESSFMHLVATKLSSIVKCEGGFSVVRFNFPYIDSIKKSGKRRPPDRTDKLIESFKDTIQQQIEDGAETLHIGGKSMGGRIASMICDDVPEVKKLICLGYPFHPPSKPEKLRTQHLYNLQTSCLICQGERDKFGNLDEVHSYDLPEIIKIRWIKDGEHSFVPRKKSGTTETDNINDLINEVANFISSEDSELQPLPTPETPY